jgi:quercetin 2,3-dioxygenase
MLTRRLANERGHTSTDWLNSRHTFSFGGYRDPQYQGFRSLLVINDDRVAPAGGFAQHGHQDMEIITYVLSGALAHQDSLGNGSVIYPGDIQRMSAGRGIRHSEYNHSTTEPVHFLQIWIQPAQRGLPPSYEQRTVPEADRRGTLRLVAGPEGDAVTLHQQAWMYAGALDSGDTLRHEMRSERAGWLHVAQGALAVNSEPLQAGDGLAIENEAWLDIRADQPTEILLFELA